MKTLTAQRNRAFADLCLRMADADLRHGRLVNVGVIVRRAIYTPAAGYYLSYNRALRLIYGCSDICRDEDGIGLQRAEALRRAVDKYRARHPQASIPRAVADVLADNGAPRYYFRPEQGRRILADEVRRRLRDGLLSGTAPKLKSATSGKSSGRPADTLVAPIALIQNYINIKSRNNNDKHQ